MNDSILEQVADSQPAVAETTQAEETTQETPAVTEEPKLFANKYKSPDELEKGYNELYKLYQDKTGFVGDPPEKYTFDFSNVEGLTDVKIGDDDMLVEKLTPVFKDLKLTQDQANALVAEYTKIQLSDIPDADQEFENLGADKTIIANKLNEVAQTLSEDERETLFGLTTTAKETMLIYKLAGLEGEKAIPTQAAVLPAKSAQEYEDDAFAYKAKHESTIGANPEQQKIYQNLLRKALS